jgi:hypothetical protein
MVAEVREVWDNTAEEIAEWCGGVVVQEIDALDDTKRFLAVNVPCRYGVMRASQGCLVIKFDDGTFDVT